MYTYALIKTPKAALSLPPGLVGDLELVCGQQLTAIAEPKISQRQLEQLVQDDRLLQNAYVHYGVAICELFRQTTILPLKFYHCFADRQNLEEHLLTHQNQYLETLNWLDGKGEYILKFIPKECDLPLLDKQQNGKDYFLAKKQRYQQQQDYQQQQESEWEAIADRILQHYPDAIVGTSEEAKRELFLLVDKNQDSLLSQRIQNWQESYYTWKFTLSEPIPPYDFL